MKELLGLLTVTTDHLLKVYIKKTAQFLCIIETFLQLKLKNTK